MIHLGVDQSSERLKIHLRFSSEGREAAGRGGKKGGSEILTKKRKNERSGRGPDDEERKRGPKGLGVILGRTGEGKGGKWVHRGVGKTLRRRVKGRA